jgi:hypothetical protein
MNTMLQTFITKHNHLQYMATIAELFTLNYLQQLQTNYSSEVYISLSTFPASLACNLRLFVYYIQMKSFNTVA